MSLWFLLWFILSFILLGATCWSTIILMQQKQAWKDYAARKGLSFTPNKFFEPASVEGAFDGYNVALFTGVQQNPDARKNRQRTILQVTCNQPFVDGVGACTQEVYTFLQSLNALSPHEVKVGKWNKNYYIHSRHKAAVDAYFNEERVSVLNGILSMPNADILVLLSAQDGVFRFETANPLKNANQVESLIKKLMVRIEKLKPSAEEIATFKSVTPVDAPEIEPEA